MSEVFSDMPNCHLVSFADGAFINRAEGFKEEASSMGIFNTVTVYKYDELEEVFKSAHGQFVRNNKRGFGYWIWKPQCILQRLKDIEDDDLVVYADVGYEINSSANYRLIEYLQITLASDFKMLSFSNTHTEYRWTKMDLAKRLGLSLSSKHMLTTQLSSGFFCFQNTSSNRDLIRKWRDICVENNYRYSSDVPSMAANHSKFVEHRHDQSIFSLLRKDRGTEVSHYEVQSYSGHFEKIKMDLPFWASRKGRIT